MITNIEQLKDLVAFMKSHGVEDFTVNGISVKFGNLAQNPSQVLLDIPPSEQLSNIKSTLKALKEESDADEMWSV